MEGNYALNQTYPLLPRLEVFKFLCGESVSKVWEDGLGLINLSIKY